MKKRSIHEEVAGDFFASMEKKKSAKIRRIIHRIIRLIIPIFFSWLFFCSCGVVLYLLPVLKDDFGVVVTLFCALFLVPIYCIIYGTSVAKNEKRKYLFSLYNPVISVLSFLCIGYPSKNVSGIHVSFFMWLSFWTLVPVRIYNYRQESEKSTESANDTQEKR